MGRKRRNNVYRHYMLQEETQTSTCLLCYKTLNSIHGSNLMNHLRFMHKLEYQQILALNNEAIPPKVSPHSNDDDSNQSESLLEVDVDKFFTMEIGTSRARCDVCQASVEINRNSLITHLKRDHPDILKPHNDSEAEDQDDHLYQEVVYLYDSDSKSSKHARPIKLAASTPLSSQKQKVKKKVRELNKQSITVAHRKRPRTQEMATSPPMNEFTEELENFGKYVTCLMKTVPQDLCTELQMKIINLIMTAKIKNMSKTDISVSPSVEKLGSVSAEPCNQPTKVTVDASKLKNSTPSPPASIIEEMHKTESN